MNIFGQKFYKYQSWLLLPNYNSGRNRDLKKKYINGLKDKWGWPERAKKHTFVKNRCTYQTNQKNKKPDLENKNISVKHRMKRDDRGSRRAPWRAITLRKDFYWLKENSFLRCSQGGEPPGGSSSLEHMVWLWCSGREHTSRHSHPAPCEHQRVWFFSFWFLLIHYIFTATFQKLGFLNFIFTLTTTFLSSLS